MVGFGDWGPDFSVNRGKYFGQNLLQPFLRSVTPTVPIPFSDDGSYLRLPCRNVLLGFVEGVAEKTSSDPCPIGPWLS